MSSNIVNAVSYLKTSKDFPEDPQALRMELIKFQNDTANTVNSRTIGLYPMSRPAVNGEEWFFTGRKQQGLRQVYTFKATGSIPHNLSWSSVYAISKTSYGSFTDGTNWYGCIFAGSTAIVDQVSFYVTSTDIVVVAGAGAPSITSGIIVLEWISNV